MFSVLEYLGVVSPAVVAPKAPTPAPHPLQALAPHEVPVYLKRRRGGVSWLWHASLCDEQPLPEAAVVAAAVPAVVIVPQAPPMQALTIRSDPLEAKHPLTQAFAEWRALKAHAVFPPAIVAMEPVPEHSGVPKVRTHTVRPRASAVTGVLPPIVRAPATYAAAAAAALKA
jgi:hypothetical protein